MYKNDGHCDDITNIKACDFDGGDCCKTNVLTSYCTICECLEPCEYTDYVGDGYCDDKSNMIQCDYDGGDCCVTGVITDYCDDCICYADYEIENQGKFLFFHIKMLKFLGIE